MKIIDIHIKTGLPKDNYFNAELNFDKNTTESVIYRQLDLDKYMTCSPKMKAIQTGYDQTYFL